MRSDIGSKGFFVCGYISKKIKKYMASGICEVIDYQRAQKGLSKIFDMVSKIFQKCQLTFYSCQLYFYSMRARVIFYDEKSGEVIEEVDRGIFIGRNPYADSGFTKFFVAFLLDILTDPEFGQGAWRLLAYIATRLDYDSLEVFIVPDKVAKEMGVTRQSVYNWLKVLLKKDVLEKRATHLYRLRPYTIVKGYARKANAKD